MYQKKQRDDFSIIWQIYVYKEVCPEVQDQITN